ncbi:MAG: carboxylating nicotinate-nucleotide diphosphorylase, partial [Phycisphaerae bacterium]|nr:carboxylating nicotinate-nucleotide diphosphorylase [Phycisphaerae bacterium]
MPPKPTHAEVKNFRALLKIAYAEDMGETGDVTALLLPADLQASASFTAREELVLCGGCFLDELAKMYGEIETSIYIEDGATAAPGATIAKWTGPARAVMSAERTALNLLQHLSGVATQTHKYVEVVAGTGAKSGAKILDTRKTTPAWRELEKYAVRTGGGTNHRRGLYDAVLVKDNHLAALLMGDEPVELQNIGTKLKELAAKLSPDGFVEIEVDTLDQLAVALTLPVDIILLDNMPPATLRKAITMRNDAGLEGKIQLEASGGITMQTLRAIAETGVERISV